MGLSVAKGVLTSPGATGNVATTGLGFAPKALMVWCGYQAAAGQSNGPGRYQIGFGTFDGGTVQQGYAAYFNPDNAATATMTSGCNTTALLKGLTAPSATTVGTDFEVDLVSLDADGFTLNWADLPATASIKVHYLALGGTDITGARVTSSTIASNTTTNVTVVAGFGQPDLILATGSTGGFSFTDTAAAGNMFLGAGISNTSRQQATLWSEDAAPAENLVGSQRQKFIYTFRGSSAGGAAEANADLSAKASWPTDGFQVTNSGATSADSIIFLALKGTFQAALGTVTSSSTLNATSDLAAGFTPSAALYWGLNQPSIATDISADGAGVQWGAFGVGAYDGTNQGFAAISSDVGNTTISTGQSHSETKAWQAIDPATTGAPTLQGEGQASFSGSNARLTWTDADTVSTRSILVLALGAAAGGGGTGWTQPVNDTLTGTDAVAKTATHPLADTGTLADTTAKAPKHPVADTGTLADTISKAPGKRPADTVTGSDTQAKTAAHQVADTLTGTDTTAKAAAHPASDTLTASDTQAKTARHPVADTLTGTDTQAKSATHPIADTGTLGDNVSSGGATNYTLPLSDTLTGTDAQAKTARPTLAETLTGVDTQAKTVRHPVADSLTGTETVAKTAKHPVADTGTLTDNVSTGGSSPHVLPLADTLTATDQLSRTWVARITLADTAELADQVTSPSIVTAPDGVITITYTEPATRATHRETSRISHTEPAQLAYGEASRVTHAEHAHLAHREHT